MTLFSAVRWLLGKELKKGPHCRKAIMIVKNLYRDETMHKRPFQKKHALMVLPHLHTFNKRRMRLWGAMAAQHGAALRISELLALERRDVRLMQGGAVVTVTARWAKNHKTPKCTVVTMAQQRLMQWGP